MNFLNCNLCQALESVVRNSNKQSFSQHAKPTAAPFGVSVWREAGGFTVILSPLAQFLSSQ